MYERAARLAGFLSLLGGGTALAQPSPQKAPVATAGPSNAWHSWIDDAAPAPAPHPPAAVKPVAPRPRPSSPALPVVYHPTKAPPAVEPVVATAPVVMPAPVVAPALPAAPPARRQESYAPPTIQLYVVLAGAGAPTTVTAQAVAGQSVGHPVSVLVAGPVPPGALEGPTPLVSTGPASAVAPAAPASGPPPYSLPWQLRSALLANVIRLDTVFASDRDDDGKPGVTNVANLLACYKVTPHLMPLVRLGAVRNVTSSGAGSTLFLNPVAGVSYAASPAPGLHLAGFLGLALPVGGGGGNGATAQSKAALKSGGNARSAMDGAMFAVNDLGALLGGDAAYLRGRASLQIEATLIQLGRVRGAAAQKDANRTNLTSGIHAGYFVMPQLSLGAELRHQRWLSTPAAVAADPGGASRDTTTIALGARLHARLGQRWVRPGVSVTFPVDKPYSSRRPTVIQLDLPVAL
jgi:hypothetical protein